MNQAQLAQELATKFHHGQVDKVGVDYIEHPTRVAAGVDAAGGSDAAIAAAWLHDVIEDCAVTRDDLSQAGIDDDVLDAVVALTKIDGQSLEEYFAGVRANPIAVLVKTADINDNTNPERSAQLDDLTRERLRVKYIRSRKLLAGDLA